MSFLFDKRILLTSLIAASSAVQAQQEEGFTVTPSAGYYNMDNHRGIKNDNALSLSLGYQFDNPWAVEFVYLNGDHETSTGNNNVDVDQFRLDGLYHLAERNQFTPYLAAGVGKTDLSLGPNNPLINAGGGLKYALNDTVSLRGDFRLIKDVEDHELDNLTTIGVHFVFGGDSTNTLNTEEQVEENVTEAKIETVDTDSDGVNDEDDLCPTTLSNVAVDSKGCALDDDKDGVANHLDMCSNSSAGVKVNEKGCQVVLEKPKSVHLNVQFAYDSAVINPEYYAQIEEVADFLTEYPNTNATIEGHTDDRGSVSYNQTISEKRAQAIVDVLVNSFGISADRLNTVGYGEEQPLLNNDTEENRSINRRVTAVISSEEG
ncbi:OmpA family protein [Marinomonas sp. 5E14-1]|uniref:OmpA family protein n=1 Tax=Marinomonas sp. 5E14-1 TaxID=3153922 RepID=UPI003267D50C